MRRLNRIVTNNPFFSVDGTKHDLEKLEVTVCRKTVVSYFRQLGFISYYESQKSALTKKYKDFRLKCAKKHVDWTTNQWTDVVRSDESLYTVEGADGGVRVLLNQGERYKGEFNVPITKCNKGSVMLWGCFWWGGFDPLVFVEGNTNWRHMLKFCHKIFNLGTWKPKHRRTDASCCKKMGLHAIWELLRVFGRAAI